MLKRDHGDGEYIIKWHSNFLDKNISYKEELVAILDRGIQKLRIKEIQSLKVQWKYHPIEEDTWEIEREIRHVSSLVFEDTDTLFLLSFLFCLIFW